MGFIVIYTALVVSCALAIVKPSYGCIAFYLFVTLDPAWNWRWAFPVDPGFQKWIVLSTAAGFALQYKSFRFPTIESRYGALALVGFLAIVFLSAHASSYSDRGLRYLDVLWRVLLPVGISLLTIVSRTQVFYVAIACLVGQGYNAFRINEEYFTLGFCRYAYQTDWGLKGLDNNGYSILTIPILAIATGFALSPLQWRWRVFAGIIALLEVHQIMLMESRGGMIGALLAFLIAAWYCPKKVSTINVLMIGTILATALAGPPVIREFASAFNQEGQRDASAESRFYLWKAGTLIAINYPLLGVGPDASRFYVPRYYDYFFDSDLQQKALHNLFFEVICENGIFAGVVYFSFFLFPWYSVWRSRRALLDGDSVSCALALTVLAGIPGYLLSSMFSSGSLIETSYILSIIGCGLLAYRLKEQMDQEQRNIAYISTISP